MRKKGGGVLQGVLQGGCINHMVIMLFSEGVGGDVFGTEVVLLGDWSVMLGVL